MPVQGFEASGKETEGHRHDRREGTSATCGPNARIRDAVTDAMSQLERLPRLVGRAEAVVEALSADGGNAVRRGGNGDPAYRQRWTPNWLVIAMLLLRGV